ncbi:hypothetical protein NEOLI_003126 [Neolecta irregularis DAH-3]|uniref:DUF218 domain-containing protein n=1 Tax=Neolecta irregularis (strain DAH-3) TaxID=1198029 RepID=A0A1U7LNG1_NEOID|nr:hypothetical protein NEOLI_003126 [Neolecta irregularis DAH-3]|eukprot:OLL24082.1 hypothetical protein NEOLI_003126 [Neolecta irregularis DAH-3]
MIVMFWYRETNWSLLRLNWIAVWRKTLTPRSRNDHSTYPFMPLSFSFPSKTYQQLSVFTNRWRISIIAFAFILLLWIFSSNFNLDLSSDKIPKYSNYDGGDFIRASHMIMVPGHAIFKGTGDGISDSDWILQPFQYGQGPTFIQHIESSLDLALQDSESLVIFSGGQSRKDAGMRSESQSYWELAKTRGLLDKFNKTSVFIEEFARDSFENLLFSVCRFYELAGSFPTKITVVGLDFKRSRFQNQHRKALMIPQDRQILLCCQPDM